MEGKEMQSSTFIVQVKCLELLKLMDRALTDNSLSAELDKEDEE